MWGLDHVRVQKSWSLPTLRLGGLRPSVAVEIILPIVGICPWWSLPQALSRCFRTLTIVLGTQIFLCAVLVFLPAPLCVDEVGWGKSREWFSLFSRSPVSTHPPQLCSSRKLWNPPFTSPVPGKCSLLPFSAPAPLHPLYLPLFFLTSLLSPSEISTEV